MTPNFDFESAATAMEAVVAEITDDQLDDATPCGDMSVREVLVHVIGLTEAFRQAATKQSLGRSAPPDAATAPALPEDWRSRIATQLKALVAAWREPSAWEGETEAGGVRAPAAVMAMIALDEVVVHSWDLAAATGRYVTHAPADLAVLLEFLAETPPEGTPGLFGPIVPVPDSAPALDRVLGLTGRNPAGVR
jgi:uncharacterized protein (TIGR03086 family)